MRTPDYQRMMARCVIEMVAPGAVDFPFLLSWWTLDEIITLTARESPHDGHAY